MHADPTGNVRSPASPDARVPSLRRAARSLAAHWAHRVQADVGRRRTREPNESEGGVRILCYHRVAHAPDDLAVSPNAFRAQMEALVASGAVPKSLDDALDLLESGIPGRYACVTFDDGYHDNLDNALPVLQELRIPATIFVTTGFVDGTAPLYWYARQPPVLSWDDVREIARDGLVAIGAHSLTHLALPKLSDENAWNEIAESKREIERQTGRHITSFSYPAGAYGEREMRLVRAAGFRMGLTCDPGVNRPGQRPEALRRSLIDRRDSLHVFEAKLVGLLDHPWSFNRLRSIARAPAPYERRPRHGSREPRNS